MNQCRSLLLPIASAWPHATVSLYPFSRFGFAGQHQHNYTAAVIRRQYTNQYSAIDRLIRSAKFAHLILLQTTLNRNGKIVSAQ